MKAREGTRPGGRRGLPWPRPPLPGARTKLNGSHTLPDVWQELDLPRHKAEFYGMWRMGVRAGLAHIEALEKMGLFEQSPAVEQIRSGLVEGGRRRDSLSDTIDRHRRLFAPFEAELLKLGEESGGIEEILGLLVRHFEEEHRRVLRIKRKMAYPMATAIAAIFIIPFPVLFFGDVATYLVTVIVETALALFFGGAFVRLFVRRYRDRPRVMLARLCRALAIGIEAGLPLDRVVDLGVAVAEDRSLEEHRRRLPAGAAVRQPLEKTFAGWSKMPAEVVQALRVAGETGDYTGTLKRLAELYDDGF